MHGTKGNIIEGNLVIKALRLEQKSIKGNKPKHLLQSLKVWMRDDVNVILQRNKRKN